MTKLLTNGGIGCLAYVMLTGNYIFNYEKEVTNNEPGNMEARNQIAKFSRLNDDEKKKVIEAKQRLRSKDCPKEMFDKILDIIVGLTKANPDSRLPLDEVLKNLTSLLQSAGSPRGNLHPKKTL
ncbi:hypothetical protein [Endozoicomonas sp. Mp262]|uniref:hypothetical protein n=1 Tax=Endozoicomonas sp. Mp262 TaxID=2919499 RepID=UPI0021DB63DD